LAIVIESFTVVKGNNPSSQQWLDDGLHHRCHRIVSTILPSSTADWLLGKPSLATKSTNSTSSGDVGGGSKKDMGGESGRGGYASSAKSNRSDDLEERMKRMEKMMEKVVAILDKDKR